MKRRAEQIDETTQRITEAAVRLHTSIGPAHTSIAKVAAEADVTRLTVYRHFADLDTLFEACIGHWYALNPMPEPSAWLAIEDLETRANRVFRDLYAWYRARDDELYPIYRDWSAMPLSAQHAAGAATTRVAEVLLATTSTEPGEGGPILSAIARHLVDFWTWRSLEIRQGLDRDEVVSAATAMLLAATGRQPKA